jgi:ankyrin repeat protein
LIKFGANVNAVGYNGLVTALCLASITGNIELAKLLIECGANVNRINGLRATPLHWVCITGKIKLAKLLIEHGANVNEMGSNGITPLHWACFKGRIELAKLLIEHGACVNAMGSYRETALHYTCVEGHIKVAKLLVEKGGNIHMIDNSGLTPLHKAYRNNHIELAKWFISHLLSKNIKEEKPDFIEKDQDLLVYWNDQIKINYLLDNKIIGCKNWTESIIAKNFTLKNDSLSSLSFHRFFNLLNPETIKNSVYKTDQLDTTMSHKLSRCIIF